MVALQSSVILAVFAITFFYAGRIVLATSELIDIDQPLGGEYFGKTAGMCQSFIPTRANLTKINYNINGAPTRLFNLCKGSMNYLTNSCAGAELIASSSVANTISFSPYLEVVVGDPYYFCVYPVGAESTELHNFTSGGCSAGFPYGCYYYNNLSDRGFYDLRFSTYYNTNFIDFEFPTDATTTPDFNNWVIRYEGGELGVPYSITLNYGTSTLFGFIDTALVGQFSGFNSWSVEKTNSFPNGRYYAMAILNKIVNFTPIPVASTSIITFLINDTAKDTYFNFNLFNLKKPGDPCEGIATTTLLGGLECGIKRSGIWLVYPDATTLQDSLNSINEFKDTFPFSAFFDITDTIKNAISSTTMSTAGFSVPSISATSSFIMIPVLSSTTISNAVGVDNSGLIRTGLSFIMWLGAIVLIYFTIR